MSSDHYLRSVGFGFLVFGFWFGFGQMRRGGMRIRRRMRMGRRMSPELRDSTSRLFQSSTNLGYGLTKQEYENSKND